MRAHEISEESQKLIRILVTCTAADKLSSRSFPLTREINVQLKGMGQVKVVSLVRRSNYCRAEGERERRGKIKKEKSL